MRIAHVTIKNILGTRELEFSPSGSFTEISGPNGSGKTTVLEAIKAVFKGGHDATLLRDGAEKGEIVLVLDDGTQIKKTIRETSSNTTLVKDGKQLPKPAELIKSLVDKLSNNPIEFLTAKKEDRVSIFLQSMPLTIDPVKLQEISGVTVPDVPGMHAYLVIDHVYTQVFDDRTSTNRAVKEKEHTIKQLREALPEAPDGVIGGETELEAQLTALDAQKDTDLGTVHGKLSDFTVLVQAQIATTTTNHDAAIQHVADSFDKEIEELQRSLEAMRLRKTTDLAAMRAAKQAEIEQHQARIVSVTGRADLKRAQIKDEHRTNRAPIETQLNLLRANRDLAARRAQTLETVTMLETELGQLKADVDRQAKALDAIKAYKSEVLANLPIPGLEVRGGEIYRDNVVFDRLNQAQRVDIAVEIAKLRAGDLGVICVDGIEALDSATFEAFREGAQKTPLQFFVSHVTDAPFAVTGKSDVPF